MFVSALWLVREHLLSRWLKPVGVAFCVTAGVVFAEFAREPRPLTYLNRPLVAAVILSIIVGLIGSLFGRASLIVIVVASAWIINPGSLVALGAAAIAVGLIAYRLWARRVLETDKPLTAAAVGLLIGGLISVFPFTSWSEPARASRVSARPTFLVLLDGYPRADTLAGLGVDITPFLDALTERGFDHYPDATSHHKWTYEH